jgi:hypothetical protein
MKQIITATNSFHCYFVNVVMIKVKLIFIKIKSIGALTNQTIE